VKWRRYKMTDYKHKEGVKLQNLLTNSGFGVVGSAIVTGNDADFSGAGNWADAAGWSVAGGLHDASAASSSTILTLSGLTPGKLYKFTKKCNAYTGGTVRMRATDNSGVLDLADLDHTPTAGQDTSVIWECVDANDKILMTAVGLTADFDNADVHEVTPGCVAADALGPDGWRKDITIDVWREHNGSNTKDGSFYSIKCTPTAVDDYIRWPKGTNSDLEEHYTQFIGRTVAFGAWVKTSTANHVTLEIDQGSITSSSFHTGGGSYEWLEVSAAVSDSAVSFRVSVRFALSSGDAYVSQPMLVFGSSIGEGNYVQPPGEIIYFEKRSPSTKYDSLLSQSDVAVATLNIEADSNGAVPKGVKAVCLHANMQDSSTSIDNFILTRADVNQEVAFSVGGTQSDVSVLNSGWTPCSTAGDIDVEINAGGVNTLDIAAFYYLGVMI
jgi:hypothetical protein